MKAPRGGTELQVEMLNKHVDQELLKQVRIDVSLPEMTPLSKDTPNILWIHNNYDQLKKPEWYKDKSNHKKYDFYVYNSHWTYEKFRMAFDMPTNNAVVIKNGIPEIKCRDINKYKEGDPIKMIYHSTPWRGLNILLGAMQTIKNKNITLDVYSSTEIYGSGFKDQAQSEYQPLFDQAMKLPNVNYIGYKPYEEIIAKLPEYDIFPYPSIWEETFCGCAAEAMAAGIYTIVTNYGALFETCAEFPVYIPYDNNTENLVHRLSYAIDETAQMLHLPNVKEHLKRQSEYFNAYYNWDKQGRLWTSFLKGVIGAANHTKQ